MKTLPFAQALMLVLTLVSCASKKQATEDPGPEASATAAVALPEVRYYVIADT